MSGKILSIRGLNTLMFKDPYAKLCFTTHLVSQYEKVIYFDLDTAFTAYLNARLVKIKNVEIYLPSDNRLVPMLNEVLESMAASSLVIFDSVNSFYNLFGVRRRISSLNHLLSVLLMLLVRRGMDEKVPVLVTSMLRYRKDGGWVESPASRRFLHRKSASKLSVERIERDIEIVVERHESIPPCTHFVYKDILITI